MPPVLGLMCALDVMGYSTDQMFTVPFLVLVRAEEKVRQDGSAVNKRMLKYIKKTCLEITKSKEYKNKLVEQLVAFAYQKDGESTRTADKIKSIPVLLTQAYCLFELEGLAADI